VVGEKDACCEIFDAIVTSVNLKGTLKVMYKLQLEYDKLSKMQEPELHVRRLIAGQR